VAKGGPRAHAQRAERKSNCNIDTSKSKFTATADSTAPITARGEKPTTKTDVTKTAEIQEEIKEQDAWAAEKRSAATTPVPRSETANLDTSKSEMVANAESTVTNTGEEPMPKIAATKLAADLKMQETQDEDFAAWKVRTLEGKAQQSAVREPILREDAFFWEGIAISCCKLGEGAVGGQDVFVIFFSPFFIFLSLFSLSPSFSLLSMRSAFRG